MYLFIAGHDAKEQQVQTRCYHCGEDCEQSEIIKFENHDFCCTGCKTVFQLLDSKDLCNYYTLEENPGISLNKVRQKNTFAFLDNPEIERQLLDFKEGTLAKVSFFIPVIHCSSCVWLLENLHKLNEGISFSRANFTKKQVYITFDVKRLSLRQLVELLYSLGYEPSINLGSRKNGLQNKQKSTFYIKLGVAAFCFGNIMLLSFPEYLGIDRFSDVYTKVFGYLNLILALPVFLYSASDYLISAFNSFKSKTINIDVPISLGIVALYFRSATEILLFGGAGYMDSLAGLVFFLLIGKWFQNQTYDALSFDRDYKSYFPISVLVHNHDDENKYVPVEHIKKGDTIILKNQDLIPCDAVLKVATAKIDYSFVTGESESVTKRKGDRVYAGGRLLGTTVKLVVEKSVQQSYLTQLWNQEVFSKDREKDLDNFISRVSKYFTISVLVIATLSAFVWWFINPDEIVNVFTAVLIIACPCALALSVPFTFGHVMRIFGNNGFYLKSNSVIDRLSVIDTVVFDKTGTITLNNSSTVRFEGEVLNQDDLQKIKSVVTHSNHPLSRSIDEFITGSVAPVSAFREIPGKGLEGEVSGVSVRIGSRAFVGQNLKTRKEKDTCVYVSFDGRVLGCFSINKQLRDGLQSLLRDLGNFELHLLSGDHQIQSQQFNGLFKSQNMKFNQAPQDKLSYISALQDQGRKVLMIGDGLNDAGALKQSDVGVAISNDVYSFTPASDAILDAKQFTEINAFILATKRAMRVVKMSFLFSFFYNIVGLYFAVQGQLSPIIAAILMPLSSVSIVVFTTLMSKTWVYKVVIRR